MLQRRSFKMLHGIGWTGLGRFARPAKTHTSWEVGQLQAPKNARKACNKDKHVIYLNKYIR